MAGATPQSEPTPTYRALFSLIREPIFVVDGDTGTIVDANPSAEAFIGRTLSELQLMHHSQLHPSNLAEVARQVFAESVHDPAASRRQRTIRDWEVLHRDGRRIPVEILSEVIAGSDGAPLVFGIFRDVSERRKAEEELREREQQLATIYNTVQDVIFHLAVESGTEFRFVSVNPAFLKVTGLSREKVVGKLVDEVIPESSLTMVLAKYRQAIEDRSTVYWEETSVYPSGRLTGEVSLTPVFDKEGACTHLVGS